MEPDKKKPDFSGVVEGSSSTAPEPRTSSERTYTVVSGDSLSKIAEKFYGDTKEWRRIYDANRNLIKDPDLIHPGQTFRIPDADTNAEDNR